METSAGWWIHITLLAETNFDLVETTSDWWSPVSSVRLVELRSFVLKGPLSLSNTLLYGFITSTNRALSHWQKASQRENHSSQDMAVWFKYTQPWCHVINGSLAQRLSVRLSVGVIKPYLTKKVALIKQNSWALYRIDGVNLEFGGCWRSYWGLWMNSTWIPPTSTKLKMNSTNSTLDPTSPLTGSTKLWMSPIWTPWNSNWTPPAPSSSAKGRIESVPAWLCP